MLPNHAIVVTACLLGIACSPADDATTAAWHGSVELRDSVWVVSNPDAPVFDSTQAHLNPVWAVELLPDSVVSWAAPERVRILHGVTYVLDPIAHRVAAFDTLGRRTIGFGRAGAGPGEMEAPSDLLVAGNAIGVRDGRLGRMILFDAGGNYLRSIPIPQMSSVLPIGDSALLVKSMQEKEPSWRLIHAGSIREIGPISKRGAPYALRDAGCWGDAVGNMVVFASCTRPSLLIFSPSMRFTRVASINRQEQHATEEQLERFRAYMNAKLSQVPVKPDVKTSIIEAALKSDAIRKDVHGIVVDSAAGLIGIWSQVGQQYGGGNARLDLLSLSGVYLAQLRLPRSLTAFDLDGGRLVTLAEDSLSGTVTLRSARVGLPEGWHAIAAAADSPVKPN